MKVIKDILKNKSHTSQAGFTLLETMVVIVLSIILSYIVFGSLSSLNNRQILDKEVAQVRRYVQDARVDSLNSKNTDTHGVVFATSTVSVIEVLASSTSYIYVLNNRVTLATSTLGTSTLTFARISGLPNVTGTLTYTYNLNGQVIGTSTITINALGIIQ
jgi:prepilin-type N-terminal cleavage/methylation domain-containing protein